MTKFQLTASVSLLALACSTSCRAGSAVNAPVAAASGGAVTAIATAFAQPLSNVTQVRNIANHFGDVYNARDFNGVQCNTQVVTGGAITAGAKVLTSTSYNFASADVGKTIWIVGAGTSGQTFVSTIASVSGNAATLAANAITTVSTANVTFGNNDTAGLNVASTALAALGGGVLNMPVGCMASQVTQYAHEIFNSLGIGGGIFYQIPGSNVNFVQTAYWATMTGSGQNYGDGNVMTYNSPHTTSPNVPQWFGLTNIHLYGDRTIPLTPSYTGVIATASGNITLTVSGIAGTITAGQPVYGFRVPPGTAIGAFGTNSTTGTGGNGTYALVFPNGSTANGSLTTTLTVASEAMYGQSNIGFASFGNEVIADQLMADNFNDWGIQTEASSSYAYNSTDYRSEEEGWFGTVITRNDRGGWHNMGPHDLTFYNVIDAESDDYGYLSESVAGASGGNHGFIWHGYTEGTGRGFFNYSGGTYHQIYNDNNYSYIGAGVNIDLVNNVQCVGYNHTGDCMTLAANDSTIGSFAGTMHANAAAGTAFLHITGQRNVVGGYDANMAGAGSPANTNMYSLRVDGPFNVVSGEILGIYGNAADSCLEVNGTNNIINVTDVNCYYAININYSNNNKINVVNYGATVLTGGGLNGTTPTANSPGLMDHYEVTSNIGSYKYDGGFNAVSVNTTPVASAATIAPPSTVFHVSGTTAIATITPPINFTGQFGGEFTVIADGPWSTVTTGNIATAITATAGVPYTFKWDGSKFYVKQ